MNKVDMFEVECVLNGALAVMQLAIDRMAGDIAECKTADKEDKGACANAIVAAAENIYCPALDSAFRRFGIFKIKSARTIRTDKKEIRYGNV